MLIPPPTHTLEAISKTCLERKETRTWGQLKVYAQRKRDSAKPEAGDRAKGGQTHSSWQKNSVYSQDLCQRCPTAKGKEADTGGQPACNFMIGKRSAQLEARGGCRKEIFLEMYVAKA